MKLLKIPLLALLVIIPSFVTAQSPHHPKIKIGMLLPLTGSYASGGVDNQRGVEAAMATAKSPPPLDIVYADSKADPVTGINEFRRLTDTENVFGVYVMRGAVGMPLNPLSQSSGVPLLGGAGNKDFSTVNKYAFQVWSRSDEEGTFLAQIFKDRGYDSVALLTVQDDWQSSVSDGFRAAIDKLGLKIVSDQEIIPSDSDFRSLLLKRVFDGISG